MTHSPEPLSEEYAYALTWKAATERLIAAAAIPVDEANQREAALASEDAGIDITLPPLVDSEEGRKLLSTTFRVTRHRYRQFRSRLKNEITQSKVLPRSIKDKLAEDLERRLDIDIDDILESPKLRLKISPAELDKTLLELYDQITVGPGGDVLRMIGGGGQVGLQHLYMRRQAKKEQQRTGTFPDLVPFYLKDTEPEESPKTLVGGIRRALRRNLPEYVPVSQRAPTVSAQDKLSLQKASKGEFTPNGATKKQTPKMSTTSLHAYYSRVATARPSQFTARKSFSLLI